MLAFGSGLSTGLTQLPRAGVTWVGSRWLPADAPHPFAAEHHVTVQPGAYATPRHCHAVEAELFVVLEGDGTVVLGDDDHPVRAGSIVARPPATGVAHAFRAGNDGMTFLAYGTRDRSDMCFHPDSGKILFAGLGVVARVQSLDYWDGEP